MSKDCKKSEELIKKAIVSGAKRGVCDRYGNSVLDAHGNMVAPKSKFRGTKTFVLRDGKLVEKNSLTSRIKYAYDDDHED